MVPSSMASLSLFCLLVLLLPASHGTSFHESNKLESTRVSLKKTTRTSQQASTAVPPVAICSSLGTGRGNNRLPIVHRLSPCLPLQGQESLTLADVLRLDASLIQRHFSSQSSLVATLGPSSLETIIPTRRSLDPTMVPNRTLYSVLVSYGTPEQQFLVDLDTSSVGMSLLRCKPCASGSDDCDPAFDRTRSSTFANILCGSPDCPTKNCSRGSFCNVSSFVNATYVQDVLTLAPSLAVHNFRFFCADEDIPFVTMPSAGIISLSMDRDSLPSQLLSSGSASSATLSYCMPFLPSSLGFISLGGDAPMRDKNITMHAPLVDHLKEASMYYIDLVGMSLGDQDLPILAGTSSSKGSIGMGVGVTFSYLVPDLYTWLRDSFQKQMLQYNNLSSLGFAGFDTCYNFTGLNELIIPFVQLKFSNGDSLIIERDQMLYYDDPTAAPFTMACLAFLSFEHNQVTVNEHNRVAWLGMYTLATMEVVYDVAGGKVGFIPGSC